MLDKELNDLRQLREKIAEKDAAHEAKMLPLRDQEKALELQLVENMKTAGTTIARSAEFSATINKQELPRIIDSTKFERYCLRHKSLHLFERRVARNNLKEWLVEHKVKDVAALGIEVFTKETIAFHKLGSTK